MDIRIVSGFGMEDEVRSLFSEYTGMLVSLDPSFSIYLSIQHYDDEIRSLKDKYGPPHGRLYLLLVDGEAAGCIALRRLSDNDAELKRLYIRPRYRGLHLSSLLLEKIIHDAEKIGYGRILLDTLPCLESAIRHYLAHGFVFTERYNESPSETTLFMERRLRAEGGQG